LQVGLEKLHFLQQTLSIEGIGTDDADASALVFFSLNQGCEQACIGRTGGAGECEALNAVKGWQLHGSKRF
jgi:hypothetical protein